MKEVILHLPENVQLDNTEVALIVACKLYEDGKLSLGQAAQLAGYSKRAFAEVLGKNNVSIFNHPASDLSADVANA